MNEQKLRDLASLDDKEFGNIVYSLLVSAGASPMQARIAAGKSGFIKEKLLNASDRELEMYASLLEGKVGNDFLGKWRNGGKY